jgi:AcrR family transcriptional regulator
MTTDAPYRRIAAHIRARIARGELRPGDRIPSTREIVREWGVAMATATKAITLLREDGLVRPERGRGTVVRSAAPARTPDDRTGRPGPELDRDLVLATAIAIADADGLALLSPRRVAAELGVTTVALHRHAGGRDELVTLMTDTLFAEPPVPAGPGWRARLEAVAWGMWTVFRRHPWAASVISMTRPRLMPNLMAYSEMALGTLKDLGFGAQEIMLIHLNLFGLVRGTALSLQSEIQARQDTGLTADEWMEHSGMDLGALMASGGFPGLRYVSEQGFDYDLDEVFEEGLRLVLDGIRARLDPTS